MKLSCNNPRLLKKAFPYAVVFCILAAVIPYFYSLRGEFVFDDLPLIKNDPFYVQETNPLKCWNRDFWMENKKQGLYRPFTLFTFWLDARIKNDNGRLISPIFRATNLFIHIIVTLLVLKLALRLKFGHWAAIFAAALFAVHPVHTEAVIPAYGRGELLCAFFMLLALIFHTYVDSNRLAFLFAGASFLFACWSKEHGVAILPLCFLLDLYLKRPSSLQQFRDFMKKRMAVYLFYLAVVGVFFASRYFATGTLLPTKDFFDPAIDNPIALCNFPLNFISALKVQGLALSKFFWPAVLSHDYSYAQLLPSTSVFDPKAWLPVILFLGIPVLACFLFRNFKYKMMLLVTAYVICILPSGNFIVMTGTIFGERLQYIPSILLCFFVALIMKELFEKLNFKIIITLMLAIVSAMAARTYVRGEDWNSLMSIALAGVRTAPMSIKTWNNLAVQLAQNNQMKEAIIACDRAISIYPRYVTAHAQRGIYNSFLGNFQQAEQDLRMAISLHTNHFMANYTLTALLAEQGRIEEAREIMENLLKVYPDEQALKASYLKLLGDIEKKRLEKGK
ncbi:MAG TPA: hypothetical protein DCZ94_14835 [Lentisphaeria bacterium]|nr:MAG: hypothetical protein A2X48_02990 [Lentisphaerae bacterium GWF2_49_21]HBC88224.1 hypothetical protein [Lentisphaeria bacterium]